MLDQRPFQKAMDASNNAIGSWRVDVIEGVFCAWQFQIGRWLLGNFLQFVMKVSGTIDCGETVYFPLNDHKGWQILLQVTDW